MVSDYSFLKLLIILLDTNKILLLKLNFDTTDENQYLLKINFFETTLKCLYMGIEKLNFSSPLQNKLILTKSNWCQLFQNITKQQIIVLQIFRLMIIFAIKRQRKKSLLKNLLTGAQSFQKNDDKTKHEAVV